MLVVYIHIDEHGAFMTNYYRYYIYIYIRTGRLVVFFLRHMIRSIRHYEEIKAEYGIHE